jgi:hypothetical protein
VVLCETRCNMALIVWTLVANRSCQLMTCSHMLREQPRDARDSTDESGCFVIQLAVADQHPRAAHASQAQEMGMKMAACIERGPVTSGPLSDRARIVVEGDARRRIKGNLRNDACPGLCLKRPRILAGPKKDMRCSSTAAQQQKTRAHGRLDAPFPDRQRVLGEPGTVQACAILPTQQMRRAEALL